MPIPIRQKPRYGSREAYLTVREMAKRLGPNLPVFLQYVSNGTPVEQALALFNVTLPSTPARQPKH